MTFERRAMPRGGNRARPERHGERHGERHEERHGERHGEKDGARHGAARRAPTKAKLFFFHFPTFFFPMSGWLLAKIECRRDGKQTNCFFQNQVFKICL